MNFDFWSLIIGIGIGIVALLTIEIIICIYCMNYDKCKNDSGVYQIKKKLKGKCK